MVSEPLQADFCTLAFRYVQTNAKYSVLTTGFAHKTGMKPSDRAGNTIRTLDIHLVMRLVTLAFAQRIKILFDLLVILR